MPRSQHTGVLIKRLKLRLRITGTRVPIPPPFSEQGSCNDSMKPTNRNPVLRVIGEMAACVYCGDQQSRPVSAVVN